MNPNGVNAPVSVALAQNDTYIWELTERIVGEHLLTISSSQGVLPCSYRIVARSNYDFFYATSPALVLDAGFSEPVYRK
jgi:hypothetical protein